MSKTKISTKNQNLLWAVSGGRCQYDGCNRVLYQDILTKKAYNSSYIAHIVADEPCGPRGDIVRSSELANNIKNLMLLCDVHHRLIDIKDVTGNPESRLLDMKKKHEDRIERLTSIAPKLSSKIILYEANIGTHHSPLSYDIACDAMFPDFYPADNDPIELGTKNAILKDSSHIYWLSEEANLISQFDLKVKPLLMQSSTCQYSVFAMAPQPMLIKLGVLLNDIYNVRIYQKHREPSTWKWQKSSTEIKYLIHEPVDKTKTPVFLFSLSGTVAHKRVEEVLGNDISIWEVSSDSPNNDFLKTEKQLSDFRKIVRSLFDKIKFHHGYVDLHIFPAMPISASIELGRVWMPKTDMPMIIYDQNNDNHGFFETITIK